MGDHVAVLESQFAPLASTENDFHVSTKLAILISTLEDHM